MFCNPHRNVKSPHIGVLSVNEVKVSVIQFYVLLDRSKKILFLALHQAILYIHIILFNPLISKVSPREIFDLNFFFSGEEDSP